MQPHGLFARHRKQPERIGVAHVGLGGERKARHVGERLQAVRLDARGVELGAHMRHFGVGALDGLPEPRKLQRFEVRARHGLGGGIEHRERLIGSCEVAPGNGRGYSINRQEHSNEVQQ